MNKQYQTKNGTSYDQRVPKEMVELLEDIRINKIRVRFHWGEAATGEDWGDCYDVEGTLGRSTGTSKVPLLINNSRSLGGGAILGHCIVKITTTRKPLKTLYCHPKYHVKEVEVK